MVVGKVYIGRTKTGSNKSTLLEKSFHHIALENERVRGVEPLTSPWKGDVIPLYNTRDARATLRTAICVIQFTIPSCFFQ